MESTNDTTLLGTTNITISAMGVGAWAWGDRSYWGFGRSYSETDIEAAYSVSRDAGINFFDTAEVYGFGRSERYLGNFARQDQDRPLIASKFFPYPWRFRHINLVQALKSSLRRLGMDYITLYQVHWPIPPAPVETWATGLAKAIKLGLTQAIGVTNYNTTQVIRSQTVLEKYDLSLASNQVEYNLLNRRIEFNGLLQYCRENKITLIAYSPLAQGLLTGKYTPHNPPSGLRGRRIGKGRIHEIQPLIQLMREIGQTHGGKSPAQVALNWVICKGAVPIPGAKNESQAQDNAGALGWRLSDQEISRLDAASEHLSPQRD